jgi:hypothetical protein
MMSLSKCGIVICPCCSQKSLQSNGAFFTCTICGLAITTQALIKAAKHVEEPPAFDEAVVTTMN